VSLLSTVPVLRFRTNHQSLTTSNCSISFRFTLFRTLLQCAATHPLSNLCVAHSLLQMTRVGGTPSLEAEGFDRIEPGGLHGRDKAAQDANDDQDASRDEQR
jgi:hypothetical protein